MNITRTKRAKNNKYYPLPLSLSTEMLHIPETISSTNSLIEMQNQIQKLLRWIKI